MFLDPLTSRGLMGLVAATGPVRTWRAGPRSISCAAAIALAAPLAAALAASLVCQQFSVFIVPTALYFYLLLAILVAAAIPPAAPERANRPLVHARSPSPRLFFSLCSQSGYLWPMALSLPCDRRIAAGDATRCGPSLPTVLQWQPAGAGSDLRYSRAMQQLAVRAPLFASSLLARQEAVKAGIAATRTSEDRDNAWYNLATLFAANNDAASVERSLRNAIAWAPNWFKPHWTLAQLLELDEPAQPGARGSCRSCRISTPATTRK